MTGPVSLGGEGIVERKRVNSSKLRSVGYEEKTRTLEVEMSNGEVFQYGGVYPEVYRRFMAAPNPTTFFDDKIAEEYAAKRV
jgi:KTSC domain-containing protein